MCSKQSTQGNAMSSYWIRQARHTHSIALNGAKSTAKKQGSLRLSVRARCVFFKSEILRSGSVRFGKNRKSYGAVWKKSEILRCGSVPFSFIVNPTVRFGAVFKNRKSYGAVRCGYQIYC